MNKKITLTMCVAALSAAPSIAQVHAGAVNGRIIAADSTAVDAAYVWLQEAAKEAHTDGAGNFIVTDIVPGTYTVGAVATGYDTTWSRVVINAGAPAQLTMLLKTSKRHLKGVTVTGTRQRYKVDKISPSLRLNEPVQEVPQHIEIISSAALEDQQVISMSDGVIRNVSGATRLEHWGDLYTRINMRGTQVGAFRNGVNVVNSAWGPLTEDMSFVDNIEFVKGPAGFMMANGDPSGLYNVVTKKPTGTAFAGEAAVTLGSFDLYRATLDLDGKLDKKGKLLYRLNLMDQTKNSFRAYEYNDRFSIAPVLSYKVDDATTITLEYDLQHAKMSNLGSYYVYSTQGYATLPRDFTTMPPGLDPTIISDHSVYFNLQHNINDSWKITAQAAYFKYLQTGSSMWPSVVNPDGTMIRRVSIWDAESEIKSGQVYLNGTEQTGNIRHRILAGLDMGTKNYLADWMQSYNLDSANGGEFNEHNPNYGTPVNGYPVFDRSKSLRDRALSGGGNIDQRFSGLYLQDELGFMDGRLRLTLAGRYTYVDQTSYGGADEIARRATPRVGLSYSANKQLAVYALYDEAFVPQAGVMRNGGSIKPLTGDNMEVGVKKDWLNGRWNSTLSVYHITRNNELTADPTNTANESYSVVLGQKVSQGVELDIKGEIAPGLNVIANYAYTDSRVTKATAGVPDIAVGDRIPGYATHNTNLWLSYRLPGNALKGFGLSVGCNYQVDRDTWTWGTSGTKGLPDYFRLDGGVSWEKGKMKLTANVFNILNTYLYTGSYYGYGGFYYWQAEPPRNSRFSITYKF